LFLPHQEGLTHINAYSKSRTVLGKLLSNFAHAPFTCEDGQFNSIEGYWYWLSCTHERKEELRTASGFYAKQLGRELRALDWVETPEFQTKICHAIWHKISQNSEILRMLRESTLPIVHYYAYGQPPKITTPEQGKWIWAYVEFVRGHLKEHLELC
jgi:predicted NAD-dependent protein-ADP-ribosyltransferase YbiA (DUF1768 family)